jgi:hypothetical protein
VSDGTDNVMADRLPCLSTPPLLIGTAELFSDTTIPPAAIAIWRASAALASTSSTCTCSDAVRTSLSAAAMSAVDAGLDPVATVPDPAAAPWPDAEVSASFSVSSEAVSGVSASGAPIPGFAGATALASVPPPAALDEPPLEEHAPRASRASTPADATTAGRRWRGMDTAYLLAGVRAITSETPGRPGTVP